MVESLTVVEPQYENPLSETCYPTIPTGISALRKAVWLEGPVLSKWNSSRPGIHQLQDAIWGKEQPASDSQVDDDVEIEDSDENSAINVSNTFYNANVHPSINELVNITNLLWPSINRQTYNSPLGFSPCLELGSCPAKRMKKIVTQLKIKWKEIEFTVSAVTLIKLFKNKLNETEFEILSNIPLKI